MSKRTFTIETTAVGRLFPGDIVHALEPMLGDNITVTEVTTTFYQVWSEGYVCTGQSSDAQYHGVAVAQSFQQACDVLFHKDKTYDSSKLTLWACKLFDNEADARKAFG